MPADTHEPELQRYWWLKRLSAAAAALVILLVIAWLLWFWHANRRMAQVIAELKATGLPTVAEDLNRPARPESRNGVPLLNQAIAQLSAVYSPSSSSIRFRDELPYPPTWHEMMEKAFVANAAVYPMVRHARLRGGADWQFQFSSPLPAWPLPTSNGLAGLRQLACVLSDTALYHHFRGNDREALEMILDCQYLASATGARGFIISTLNASGIDALATQRLETIATDLQIPRGEPGNVLREEIRQMIVTLSDDEPARGWYVAAFSDENVLTIDASNTRTGVFALAPLDRLEAADSVHHTRIASIALREPTRPAASAMVRSIPDSEIPLISLSNSQYLPGWLSNFYRSLAGRQMAAVSLAAALYRNDHGKYPASLDELVPAYLSKIPLDPLSVGAKPFGYLMAAHGTRPVLICAGEDGIVQTVDESYLPSNACYGWQAITKLDKCDDLYLDLSAWKDPTPPADPEQPSNSETLEH